MRKFLFAAVIGSLALASCSNEDTVAPVNPSEGGNDAAAKLRVEMVVDGLQTKTNTEGMIAGGHPWVDGDEIRLFTLNYDKFTADGTVEKYAGADYLNKGYHYVADDKTWENVSDNPVTLSNYKARLYAFSPSIPDLTSGFLYNGDGVLNPTRVPINFNTPNKVDYLYGTHRNTRDGVTDSEGDNTVDQGGTTHDNGTNLDFVDNKNPLVRLYMKHAQTYVKIRLTKEAVNPEKIYTGAGVVTQLEVMQLKQTLSQYGNVTFVPADGTNGSGMPSVGYIDITKTEDNITPTEWKNAQMTDLIDGTTKTSFVLNPSVSAGVPRYNEAYVLLAPCKDDMVRGFHIVVDGMDFYVPCSTAAKPVEWKAGFMYTYDMVMTGKALEMTDGDDGEVITVKPWNDGGTTEGEF